MKKILTGVLPAILLAASAQAQTISASGNLPVIYNPAMSASAQYSQYKTRSPSYTLDTRSGLRGLTWGLDGLGRHDISADDAWTSGERCKKITYKITVWAFFLKFEHFKNQAHFFRMADG